MVRRAAIFALMVTIVFAVASCSKDGSTGPKDKVAPEVTITNAWDAAKAGGIVRNDVVDVTVDAFDDAGINRVELFVNNKIVATDKTVPYELEWDMSSVADGSSNTLFVRAVDANGNTAKTASVTIVKGASSAPVASLSKPTDNTTVVQGDAVNFTGSANDSEDGALSDSQITWTSNLQGVIGQGATLTYRGLVIGTHEITMTATDSNGITDTKKITVTVNENALKYAVIDKGTYYIGEPLFARKTVRLTRPVYIQKKEIDIQEFLNLMAINEGNKNDKARAWADKRNKILFNTTKNTGLYVTLYAYDGKTTDTTPIVATYAGYPACFINYHEACLICNAASTRDGLKPVYALLDKNKNPIATYSATSVKYISIDKTANGWRLPTEAEYEIAARGGLQAAKFPWGDTGPGGLCNSMSDPTPPNVIDLYNGRGITPVDAYPTNRYGLYNIIGNVAEMCSDMFVGTTPSGVDPLASLEEKSPRYLVKGGAWYEFGGNMQIAMRHLTIPFSTTDKDAIGSGIGIRMARWAE